MPRKRSEFAKVLKKAREAQGLSMREIARKLGISPVYYMEVESDTKPPFPPGGKVDYRKLGELLGIDHEALEGLSGRSSDDGARELREIIVKAKEMLYSSMHVDHRVRFDSREDKGGPEDLLVLCSIYTGSPPPVDA